MELLKRYLKPKYELCNEIIEVLSIEKVKYPDCKLEVGKEYMIVCAIRCQAHGYCSQGCRDMLMAATMEYIEEMVDAQSIDTRKFMALCGVGYTIVGKREIHLDKNNKVKHGLKDRIKSIWAARHRIQRISKK